MSRFISTELNFVKLDSNVFFTFNDEVIEGKIINVNVQIEDPDCEHYETNIYAISTGDGIDEYYEDINEQDIFSSKELALKSLEGEFENDEDLEMSSLNILHLPVGEQVIFRTCESIITQGIIGFETYIHLCGDDELDVQYAIQFLTDPNHYTHVSIEDIIL